jgi:hypothetical protein
MTTMPSSALLMATSSRLYFDHSPTHGSRRSVRFREARGGVQGLA